jgi:hypothetical protein
MKPQAHFAVRFMSVAVMLGIVALAPRHAFAAIGGPLNPSFEDSNHLGNWTTAGSAFAFGSNFFGVSVPPPDGAFETTIIKEAGVTTVGTLTTFLGVTPDNLASVIGDGDLSDLSDSHGSAIKQHFTVDAPATLTFQVNLFTTTNTTNQTLYPETIVAVLDGQSYFVGDTDTAVFTGTDNNLQWTGFYTFSGLPTLSTGDHDISVAAVGAVASAGVQVDHFVTSPAVPEPASLSLLALAGATLLLRRRQRPIA